MKKAITLAIFAALMLSSIAGVYGADYTDIKSSNWAYEAVNAMSSKMIVKGYPDGSFKPNNIVTYGEFIKMALIAGSGTDVGNSTTGHWATKYYEKALEMKYFTNDEISKGQLSNPITRGDMALIVSSILGDVKIDKYDEIQKGITDITYLTEHEYDITKAYATGVLTGYTDNTFKPEKTLTRAEAAMVIYRLVDGSKRVLPGAKPESTQPKIEQVITNIDSFVNPGDGAIDEDLAAAETYEYVTDGAKYGMTLKENRGTKWIAIPASSADALGWIYLMKDSKIVEPAILSPNPDGSEVAIYKLDITQMDYIVSLDPITSKALLITNPFKK